MKKGPWTRIEDAMLTEYVKKHGEGKWNKVNKSTGLARSGKSCRLRWANHLRPKPKKGSFSPDEEHMITYMHSKIGNKWTRIASVLPGRTDNEIKNFWNRRTKRCLKAGKPLYPPSLQPTNIPLSPLSSADLFLNSTNFPHLIALSAQSHHYWSSQIPLPAPLLPPQPHNGLLQDLLGETPALPHNHDSTIPSHLSNHRDDSLFAPLSTGTPFFSYASVTCIWLLSSTP